MVDNNKLVRMTPEQFDIFSSLLRARPQSMGMGDYKSWLADRLTPAEGFAKPYGVTDFPVKITPNPDSVKELLEKILEQLVRQNDARKPLLRAINVTQVGQTLDWSAHGLMTRLMIRNKGTNPAWISFDQEGQSVTAVTPSDLSWELQVNEALSIDLCEFYKIGAKCSAGQTASIHAIAFPSNAGSFAGAVG